MRNHTPTDYWKALTEDGVYHVDNRDDVFGASTLCGRHDKPVNMPGTIGGERAVTCLRCLALYSHMSSATTNSST